MYVIFFCYQFINFTSGYQASKEFRFPTAAALLNKYTDPHFHGHPWGGDRSTKYPELQGNVDIMQMIDFPLVEREYLKSVHYF